MFLIDRSDLQIHRSDVLVRRCFPDYGEFSGDCPPTFTIWLPRYLSFFCFALICFPLFSELSHVVPASCERPGWLSNEVDICRLGSLLFRGPLLLTPGTSSSCKCMARKKQSTLDPKIAVNLPPRKSLRYSCQERGRHPTLALLGKRSMGKCLRRPY